MVSPCYQFHMHFTKRRSRIPHKGCGTARAQCVLTLHATNPQTLPMARCIRNSDAGNHSRPAFPGQLILELEEFH